MTAIWRDGAVLRHHWDEAQRAVNLGSDWATYLRFRDQLAEALDPQRHTIEWLNGEVWSGRMIVIGNERACILCKIEVYPTGAMDFHGMLAAGDLETIAGELIPYAESYGKELGCIGGLIESRAGWVRMLKKTGWEIHQTTLRKAL